MPDAFGPMTDALASIGERCSEYAEVVRNAADRNAADDYDAGDWLVDVERLWGMGLRDLARLGVAAIEASAPLFESVRDWNDAPGGSDPPPAAPPQGGKVTPTPPEGR